MNLPRQLSREKINYANVGKIVIIQDNYCYLVDNAVYLDSYVLFINLSSTFNMMKTHILLQRLLDLGVKVCIIHWIRAFLSDCPELLLTEKHQVTSKIQGHHRGQFYNIFNEFQTHF